MFRRPPIALVLVISLLAPTAAQAEGGLFGAIMNFLGGGRPAQEPAAAPEPLVPATPLDHSVNDQAPAPGRGGPQVVYCVRTCDGRYFPLARSANTTPAKICGAMCPTAETKIFSGSNIDNAVAADGSRYAGLKNAYLYRERLIEGCSCNGGNGAGNAAIDIKSDPTLRPGDIVVTSNGPMLFRGGKNEPHQRSDFAPITDAARLSAIKVARPGSAPLASPQDFARAARPAATQPAPTAEPVSPAAAVAKIFDFKDFDAADLRGSTAMGYSGEQ